MDNIYFYFFLSLPRQLLRCSNYLRNHSLFKHGMLGSCVAASGRRAFLEAHSFSMAGGGGMTVKEKGRNGRDVQVDVDEHGVLGVLWAEAA
jgi:hypothetical protein